MKQYTNYSSKKIYSLLSGFTLLEIILVLSIAVLLMGLAAASLSGILSGASINKAQADVQSLKAAIMQYQNLNRGVAPTTEQGLMSLYKRPTIPPLPRSWTQIIDNENALRDPWNNYYQYRNPGKKNPRSFDIFSMGPDGLPDTDDDIGNW